MNHLRINQAQRLLHNFWQIAQPYFFSDEKWKARGLFILTTVLMLCFNVFHIVQSYVLRDLMTAVTDKDVTNFYQIYFQLIGVFAIFVPVFVFWHYSQDLLQLSWRKWLTKHFLVKYLSNRSYYKLKSNEQIDNPDQRIAEDIDTFIKSSIDISGLLVVNIVSIFSFLGILLSIDKFLTFLAIALAVIQTIIAIFIGGRLSKLKFKQLEFQADFRYGLVHIRDNCESIAFYRGENQELATIQQRFFYVIRNFHRIINLDRNLNFFTTGTGFIISNLPVVFLAPRFFAGEIEFGEIGQASGAFVTIFTSLGLLVKKFDIFTAFVAQIQRLKTFSEFILEPEKTKDSLLNLPRIEAKEEASLAIQNLTLKTPQYERTLVKNLSLSVPKGQGILIVGHSGVGKSSLIRALAGLWNSGTGCIIRPQFDQMLFLPQRPYMILGDLRHQLLYPTNNITISAQRLQEELEYVNLPDLIERVGGLDTELNWADFLSLGEQQRLAFARLRLTQPSYAILDEATSALDVGNEKRLYQLLLDSETTYISVGHRPTLVQYHQYVLKLVGNGNWKVIPIQDYSFDVAHFHENNRSAGVK